ESYGSLTASAGHGPAPEAPASGAVSFACPGVRVRLGAQADRRRGPKRKTRPPATSAAAPTASSGVPSPPPVSASRWLGADCCITGCADGALPPGAALGVALGPALALAEAGTGAAALGEREAEGVGVPAGAPPASVALALADGPSSPDSRPPPPAETDAETDTPAVPEGTDMALATPVTVSAPPESTSAPAAIRVTREPEPRGPLLRRVVTPAPFLTDCARQHGEAPEDRQRGIARKVTLYPI